MSLGEKSFFTSFATLANLFKKPATIRYPDEDLNVHEKPGPSMIYRGMHTNALEVCIGCGTCADACPTTAIEMKIPQDRELKQGPEKNPERPVIDYGRCCFCAFCVDSCPSGSLSMSRDYIYTQPSIKEHPLDELLWKKEAFTIRPDETHEEEASWQSDIEISWLDFKRQPMEMMEADERIKGFMEMVYGFTKEAAIREAQRCVECGICTNTCPAHMDIPDYIRAIYDGKNDKSVKIMYKTNPLPSICGRICTHRCESVCALSHRGEAVSIRWLKRYAMDNVDDETRQAMALTYHEKSNIVKPADKKIGIIGAGPAGLAAGYYLAGMGYEVVIYDKMPAAGGTMRYGIPAYRLPDDVIARDVSQITAMGVKLMLNTTVGKDISWEQLKQKHDAILIAVGFPDGRSTRIENTDHKDVHLAIKDLNEIRLGKEVDIHEKVVVIGGGNVAMDIARSAARIQMKKYGKVDLLVTSLESDEEMPADREEIEEGGEEGIIFKPGWSPQRVVLNEDGSIKGLEVAKCLSVFEVVDGQKRFNPNVDLNQKDFFPATMVIEAIGQASDYSFLTEEEQKTIGIMRGRIKPADGTLQTPIDNVFIAGDITRGPDVISGIRDGHEAAQAIDTYFMSEKS